MSDVPQPQPQPTGQVPPAPQPPAEPQWTAIGKAAEFPDNSAKVVKVGVRRIGVYHHNGQWFALKDMCPHAGVSLSQGPVRDKQVMCVGHGWLFHLETGECTRGPTGVKTASYPVRVTAEGAVEIFA